MIVDALMSGLFDLRLWKGPLVIGEFLAESGVYDDDIIT